MSLLYQCISSHNLFKNTNLSMMLQPRSTINPIIQSPTPMNSSDLFQQPEQLEMPRHVPFEGILTNITRIEENNAAVKENLKSMHQSMLELKAMLEDYLNTSEETNEVGSHDDWSDGDSSHAYEMSSIPEYSEHNLTTHIPEFDSTHSAHYIEVDIDSPASKLVLEGLPNMKIIREKHVQGITKTNERDFKNVESTEQAKIEEVEAPRKFFGELGSLTSAVVMRNEDGTSTCFGFVNFDIANDAFDNKEWVEQIVHETIDEFKGPNLYIKNLVDSISDDRLKELLVSSSNCNLDTFMETSFKCYYMFFSSEKHGGAWMDVPEGPQWMEACVMEMLNVLIRKMLPGIKTEKKCRSLKYWFSGTGCRWKIIFAISCHLRRIYLVLYLEGKVFIERMVMIGI